MGANGGRSVCAFWSIILVPLDQLGFFCPSRYVPLIVLTRALKPKQSRDRRRKNAVSNGFGGGWLSALDVLTLEVWQANNQGELRSSKSP